MAYRALAHDYRNLAGCGGRDLEYDHDLKEILARMTFFLFVKQRKQLANPIA